MVVCLNYTSVFSQEEFFIDNSGVESTDISALEQNLSPVDLLIEDVNKLDSISLLSLNIFNANEIKNVIDFIEENRPLLSPYELQHVKGVDFHKLIQLITLFNGSKLPAEDNATSGYLMTRYQR
ncbi:MAG: hypothetical protein OEW75_06105, partial [Cyclobacteriaceae bacterium]|nr:hypothetical protein [Cyclobacteriaceae bacterium]